MATDRHDPIILSVGTPVFIDLETELAGTNLGWHPDSPADYSWTIFTGEGVDVTTSGAVSAILNSPNLEITAIQTSDKYPVTIDVRHESNTSDNYLIPISLIRQYQQRIVGGILTLPIAHLLGKDDELLLTNSQSFFKPTDSKLVALGTASGGLSTRTIGGQSYIVASGSSGGTIRYGRYSQAVQISTFPYNFFLPPGGGYEFRPANLRAQMPDRVTDPGAGKVGIVIHQGKNVARVQDLPGDTYPRLRLGAYPTSVEGWVARRYSLVFSLTDTDNDGEILHTFYTHLVITRLDGTNPQNAVAPWVIIGKDRQKTPTTTNPGDVFPGPDPPPPPDPEVVSPNNPDLICENPQTSVSAGDGGDLIDVTLTVRNGGQRAAEETELTFYRSANESISGIDTKIGTERIPALAAGAQSTKTINTRLPAMGTFWYGGIVDTVTDEQAVNNNRSSGARVVVTAATPPPPPPVLSPDLVVETPWVSNTTPVVSSSIQVRATVRNAGTKASVATTLRFKSSPHRNISAGDDTIGTATIPVLEIGAKSTQTVTTVVQNTAGRRFFGAIVDTVTGETNTTNNISNTVLVEVMASVPVNKPDLICEAPTVDIVNPFPGQNITLSVTVRNGGTAASPATNMRFFSSSDSEIAPTDTGIGGDIAIEGLAIGATTRKTLTIAAPAVVGDIYYGGIVQAVTGEITERNNNSPSIRVSVQAAKPDLVCESVAVSPPGAKYVNGLVSVRATVRNDGYKAAPATTLRFYRSTNRTITASSDAVIGTAQIPTLDINEETHQTISPVLPAVAGTYYFGAIVDAVADEITLDNNTSLAVQVSVGVIPTTPEPEPTGDANPDLIAEEPTVDTRYPIKSQNITLEVTIRNGGTAPSAATTVQFYRSTNLIISDQDTPIGSPVSVVGLAIGATIDKTLTIAAPDSLGLYYYGAIVSSVDGEIALGNNASPALTVWVREAKPDLVVESPWVSNKTPTVSAELRVRVNVRNEGTEATTNTRLLRFYQGRLNTIGPWRDKLIGTANISPLAIDAEETYTLITSAPATVGTYYYGAVADYEDDSNLRNNISQAVQVVVSEAPPPPTVPVSDLVVSGVRASATQTILGNAVNLFFTVQNTGMADAKASSIKVYQSTSSNVSPSDTQVGSAQSVHALSAGSSTEKEFSVTSPSAAGTLYFAACVDTYDGESDATNNCSDPIAIQWVTGALPTNGPDLVVESPTNPAQTAPLQNARLRATVRNNGNRASVPTTLRFRRAKSEHITENATLVGTAQIPALDADGGDNDENTAFVDVVTPDVAGTYYYGACVDTVTGETDATNNCSMGSKLVVVGTRRITSTPIAAADLIIENFTATPSFAQNGQAVPINLNCTVQNIGTLASPTTTVLFWEGTVLIARRPLAAIQPNEQHPVNFVKTTSPTDNATKSYTCSIASFDGEADATNNGSGRIRVTRGPGTTQTPPASYVDLQYGTPTLSEASGRPFLPITLTITLTNRGNVASTLGQLRFYRSRSPNITTNDTLVGDIPFEGVGINANRSKSVDVILPAQAGTYYYGACVHNVGENIGNECSSSVLATVTGGDAPAGKAPDLVVENPTFSANEVEPGAEFQMNIIVRNQGEGHSPPTRVRFLRSTTTPVGANDTAVGLADVPLLAPYGSRGIAIKLTALNTPQVYYYAALVESVDTERDATNNLGDTIGIAVGVPAGGADPPITGTELAEDEQMQMPDAEMPVVPNQDPWQAFGSIPFNEPPPADVARLVGRPYTRSMPRRGDRKVMKFILGEVRQEGPTAFVSLQDLRRIERANVERLSGGIYEVAKFIPEDFYIAWPPNEE